MGLTSCAHSWPKAFDGPYTPRIIFLEPFGQVSRVMNRDIKTHRFFYRTAAQITTSMEVSYFSLALC